MVTKRKTTWGRGGLAAVVALLLVAVAAPARAEAEIDDRDISVAVGSEIAADPAVDGVGIDVDTVDGVVTLSGWSDNILARERAVRLAKTVRGVRAVVGQIEVYHDAGRTDFDIRDGIEDALRLDPATESWEIGVAVDDGAVTLTGTVESWQEKQLAAKVAKGITGVRSLRNDIAVDYQETRPDDEIRADIHAALDWDRLVDDRLIEVVVRNGKARLSGVVGSAAEKDRAVTDAWVMGVRGVDAGKLDVEYWARDEHLREGKYVDRPDEAIARAIEDAMVYDPRVSSFDVEPAVSHGVVSLYGVVDDLEARQAAGRAARNTVGVWRVHNHVVVRPGTPGDAKLERQIEDALFQDPHVRRYDVDVEVVHRIATLGGTVDSVFEKAQAEDVASGIYGIVAVDNNLEVADGRDVLTHDPYVDEDWYVYDFEWYAYPELSSTTRTDWEIASDIQAQLLWSPFVDADEVMIEVDDGVATLTGLVGTWNERWAATKAAYDGGAIEVDNDLDVAYGPEYYTP